MKTVCLILFALTAAAYADGLNLSSVFGDHAVVQRDAMVPVWGTVDHEVRVTVEFASQSIATKGDANGNWKVDLTPMPASPTGRQLIVSTPKKSITKNDIVVGDVWHASGQSNMAMNMRSVAQRLEEAKRDIDAATLPLIRFVRITEGPAKTPLLRLPRAQWTACSPDTVEHFSAAAFYFARRIHREINVPIGIIDSSRGGTPIEPFIPRSAYEGHATLKLERELGDADDLAGLTALRGGVYARDANWLPGRLFNSRIAPIQRFCTRGVIWYQAESNCGGGEDPRDYQYKMRALVTGWRNALGNEALPFYFVQLPGSGAGAGWPYMREQQRLSLGLPHTGMAVSIDLVDPDIHPPYKRAVGERLARWALHDSYGHKLTPSGPTVKGATIDGDTVTVSFRYADSGLIVAHKDGLAEVVAMPETPLSLFETADAKGAWHPASATIDGTTVRVRSDAVSSPVAVRYAYEVSPATCHLYNAEGLPASPFCSDPKLLRYEPIKP